MNKKPQHAAYNQELKKIVNHLANRDFVSLEKNVALQNLTSRDLEHSLNDYGRMFVTPPDNFLEFSDWYPIIGEEKTWSIDVPLWTSEEGRSDLTLSLILKEGKDKIYITITDLHVL